MSGEGRAACYKRINPDEFQPAESRHVDQLEPCGFCFPEGEVDVDEDDLLVAKTTQPRSFHRHIRTGRCEWEGEGAGASPLADALRDPDVTDFADLEDALGGGA